jgi:formate dehydrogenase
MAEPFTPEETEEHTGVPADAVRALARDLAAAPSAAVYGRTGSCLGRFGTLVAFLIDALNAVTGNLDRPGGAVVGEPPIEFDKIAERVGLGTYDTYRAHGVPEVLGTLPAVQMAGEMEAGRMRALIVSAGNPVNSVPDGAALSAAIEKLDLVVSIDFYVNDTSSHADYVLPATTFLERSDAPLPFLSYMTTPFIQWSDPVVPPRGEAREETQIIEALAKELGTMPVSHAAARGVATRLGRWFSVDRLVDLLLRTGPGRLSVKELRKHPHGIVLGEHVATGVLRKRLRNASRRVELAPRAIVREVARLRSVGAAGSEDLPLRLIGLRELRSHNSWMHNAPKLMSGDRVHRLRVHPVDAETRGIADGDTVTLRSAIGSVEVPARVTDEVMPGTVALPHGWGHNGGWRVANAAGGVNTNLLAGTDTVDPLSGNAFLNGIPVALELREPAAAPAEPEAATA